MPHITRDSLWTLERYARERPAFCAQVIEHKKNRKVALGEHILLVFEDEMTIRYQIQEMLRVEKIFEERGIVEEMEAYNPLVPDGRNFKATMMLEYPDVEERRHALAQLKGVEDRVWVRVGDLQKVLAVADEDLERENDEKTSSVHFLRFELTDPMAAALKAGARLSMGVDHPACTVQLDPVPENVRGALVRDLA
jgi:Protein of unknown function (DUF3501)